MQPMLPRQRAHTQLRQRYLALSAELPSSAADLPSPCVSVCRLDPAGGFCLGCLRTLDELAGWAQADAPTKREVWERIKLRLDTWIQP